ncbi:hypothetical protein PUNSTDRAFT_65603 [Punctularia strigosozonata HHB-11173 SS5]|uniref:uncharacterized protein n=1 Tax=Punctularia strigosozonata (strain HHB-11173) TaxID=741275 RepID=UPI00044175F0|nr:uncharacterized protein PUNSTDRAFT_65603 [Punctularia strigosozonata HHB-11173 SS5]EIN10761.1 hypothetical protein PUNSTDRAFT_65603 [Punctularia strigosozonata HHB-11173 SS5]
MILAVLALSGYRTEEVNRPSSSTPSTYAIYDAVLSTPTGTLIDTTVRQWTPRSALPLPDGTVALVLGKAYTFYNSTISSSEVMIDAIVLSPFPGDVTDLEAYERGIPDIGAPIIFALGRVQNAPAPCADGESRFFNLSVSEWLRDGNVDCVHR